MKDILDVLNIDDDDNNLQIISVDYVLEKKQVNINIKGKNILHFDLYEQLKLKLLEYLELNDEYKLIITYSSESQNYDAQTLISYYNYIIRNHNELGHIFNNINIEVTKEKSLITFDLNSKYEKLLIEKKVQTLLNNLEVFGFKDLKYAFHVKETNDSYKKEMAKKIKESEDKIISESKTTKVKTKEEAKQNIFGQHSENILRISDIINLPVKDVTFEGIVFDTELKELKNSHLLTIMVVDEDSTIICKTFTGFGGRQPYFQDLSQIENKMKVLISGTKSFDRYLNDDVIEINAITILDKTKKITTREDTADEKRVELHVHSKMSTNNGVSSMDDYFQAAKHFGHKAIAITDHDGVQGFVDSERASKKYGIKAIYGLEATVVDKPLVVRNEKDIKIQDETYCIFDLETTGLSANFNKIIEIGAVILKDKEITKRFQTFINIGEDIPKFTSELTGITNEDLQNGIALKSALEQFKEFYKGTTLVAHNATFDYQFLEKNEREVLNTSIDVPVLDTLELSRILNPESTFHSLKILTKKYGVSMDHSAHHRADYDSEKLAELFLKMLEQIEEEFDFKKLTDLNKTTVNKTRGFHELIYAKNQLGLVDMYRLVSLAHTEDFLLTPRVRAEYINEKKVNLLHVGSGCIKSKLVDYYLNKNKDEIEQLINNYDYIELHPKEQYIELIKNDTFKSFDDVITMQREFIRIAKKVNTKVFASSNTHFVNPEEYKVKEILIAKDLRAEKVKKNKETGDEQHIDIIRFNKLVDEKEQKFKSQFYHTTNEMLEIFGYLDEEDRFEIVIKNTNDFANNIGDLKIIPEDLFTPEISGVDKKLKEMVFNRAASIYSDDLPEIVKKRVEKEVNSITKYGFSVIYYISHKLVKHSLDNGYLVGSRGSVGSSIVATFMDITEINPLPPHYVCPSCKHSEFFTNHEYASGFDLPQKKCPNCNEELIRDGQDIPFETFLGFEGDKVPDIDLNFSGEFQANAHEYVRSKDKINDDELFDYNHAFRAGTIGTLAEKTAYAYTRNYFELQKKPIRRSDIFYYSKKCEGIKRTTGQHPGGIIVVPNHMSIFEFTPIQYPANDKSQPWRTTHFDFHSIHDNLLKLDILGHDDPTMLKKMFSLTGIDPKNVDVADVKVLDLFSSAKSLGIEDDEMFETGTLGVPEFGTNFVIEMLKDTKPNTFAELVQISGLSHGTDVWLGNAQELIRNKTCTLKEVISCRDDIMVYLMYQNIDPKQAFFIMENVRKGKGLTSDEIKVLKENNIPNWYIDSCQKIKYMFPKAHAAAYVLMALRIAYYKVYYPLEYYCAYFSSRVDDFDPLAMIKGEEKLIKRIELLDEFETDLSDAKKKSLRNSLKMSLEMCKRGYKFTKFDINKSQAYEFVLDKENNGLILPFGVMEGLGTKEALRIVEEREKENFKTKEDFKKRTKIKNKTFEQLEYFNVLDGLEDSNQTKLF